MLHRVSVNITATAYVWVEAADEAAAQARVEAGTGVYSTHVGSQIGEWTHVTPTSVTVVGVVQLDAE